MESFCSVLNSTQCGIGALTVVPDGSEVVGVSSAMQNQAMCLHVTDITS